MKLKAKKHFGQNFLQDQNILRTIIETSEISQSDNVIEVGPGHGVLTKELVKKAGHVDVIEIDNDLIPKLNKTFQAAKNFSLHNQDVLTYSIPKKEYKLIANIPYYLTSPILRHFISEAKNRPKLCVLMVQKEVAEKICDTKKQSLLSWQVKLFGTPSIVCNVPPHCFTPPPKVDSAVLKIEMHNTPLIKNYVECFKIMKIAFSEKRKQLAKVLSKKLPESSEDIKNKLTHIGISPQVRAEALTLENWKNIVSEFT